MATFGTLISGALAPVGQRVDVAGTVEPPPQFAGYTARWTSSGTAALVLALRLARQHRPAVGAPCVLIPAYGCPDLLTAAVTADVRPVLVDVDASAPGFDMEALRAAWCDDVIAVVAVNFLGIAERLDELRALTATNGALLIEDCAQWYPERPLSGDAVVLSFGRGKPVNLLGGGALLAKDGVDGALFTMPPADTGAAFALRAAAFNAAVRPRVYAWTMRVPFAGIGATRYRESTTVAVMDSRRLGHLARNARAWLARSRWREEAYDGLVASLAGFTPLTASAGSRVGRLLRYPLLAAGRPERDRALRELNARGLGASPLYGEPLAQVQGVPASVAAQGPFAGAQRFAERLLTLPLHDGVDRCHIDAIAAILRS